jgi:MoaA/NifB/PqqE/SkfB family radical SAM enzyme
MTMDAHPTYAFPRRPKQYHKGAANAADRLTAKSVRVGMQTILTRDHWQHPELLDDLYDWLCNHGIAEWSLLRFFPSGRGVQFPWLALSDEENFALVNYTKAPRQWKPLIHSSEIRNVRIILLMDKYNVPVAVIELRIGQTVTGQQPA